MLMMNLFMWLEDSRVVKLMAAYVIANHSPMPQTSGNDLSMRATQWRGLSGAGAINQRHLFALHMSGGVYVGENQN